MIPNQLVTWLNRVRWIIIEQLWLNEEEDGTDDRAPDGGSPEDRRESLWTTSPVEGRDWGAKEGCRGAHQGLGAVDEARQDGCRRRTAEENDEQRKMSMRPALEASGLDPKLREMFLEALQR